MSKMTADLEYLQCDMCGTYLHKDIFCDHRRECKGKDSQELKKRETNSIMAALDEDERKHLTACGRVAHPTSDTIPIQRKEQLQTAAVRKKLQQEVWKETDPQVDPEKMIDLLKILDE